MSISEELSTIAEGEKDILPLLKGLDKKQKKELVPAIKKLQKHYSEFIQQGNTTSYSQRGTTSQKKLLGLAGFVCFNQKEFEQGNDGGTFNKQELTPILNWYCPDWFQSYFDSMAGNEFLAFDYDWYMELIENGYLQPNRQFIARVLPGYLFERKEKVWTHAYKPENLAKRTITLDEHIWYLFEYETNLHGAENYMKFDDGSQPGRWMSVLKLYMTEGRIDRQRLLKESLLAVCKNTNQAASNWFMDLFVFLEPATAELIALQDELLNTFNLANSKPYNTVLKLFKELSPETGFAIDAFLDHVPIVLTSESKTGVTAALMVLEKLAKLHPARCAEICGIAAQALIHQDNNLQTRVARLLKKYGDEEAVASAVQGYKETLFSEARELLGLAKPSPANEPEGPLEKRVLVPISMPQNFDEFVFLASQAFEQNETYHFDLLPAAILKFQHEMTAANIQKLMPAFQRAYKMITNDWASTKGYLDNMLAKFFTSYGQLLTSFDLVSSNPIHLMHQAFVKSEEEKKARWNGYKIRLGGIKPWDIYTHSLGYKPHKHLLLNAFFLLERKISLPLLSTPTHEPCYVAITTLIERLAQYQQARTIPADMDLQVAIARCLVMDQAEAVMLANAKLTGEYRALIGLMLGEDHFPTDNSKLKASWLVAAVNRFTPNIDSKWESLTALSANHLTAAYSWEPIVEDYFYKQYDVKSRAYVDMPAKRKIIRVNFGDKQKKVPVIKSLLSKIIPAQPVQELSLYDYTELKYDYLSGEHNDIRRLLYLMPHQPEILLAHIINKGLRYIDFTGENDKRLVIYTLEALLALDYRHSPMSDLFLATCILSSDKTVRTYAAETWIKAVNEQNIISANIGQIIGRQENLELAPLKRFTDLVISNMYQLSGTHNQALEDLLTACIAHMNPTPINGTRKLLEIYHEVLATNNTKATNPEVQHRLNDWKTTDTLRKVIDRF